jgi:hypothetical protein
LAFLSFMAGPIVFDIILIFSATQITIKNLRFICSACGGSSVKKQKSDVRK